MIPTAISQLQMELPYHYEGKLLEHNFLVLSTNHWQQLLTLIYAFLGLPSGCIHYV